MSTDESLILITKGAGIVFISLFISKFLMYIFRVLVARIGTEVYGLFSLGLAGLHIAAFLSLIGLHVAVGRYVPYYIGKDDEERIKGTITSAIKISLPLSMFFGFIMFIFSDWIALNLFHNMALSPVLKIFSIAVPFFAMSRIAFKTIVGFKKIEYYALIKNILESFYLVLLLLIFIYLGYELMGVIIAYSLAIIITFLLSFYVLEKKVFPIFKTEVKSVPLKRELLSFSMPLLLSGIFGMVVTYTDIIMIGYFLNASEVGIYNVALPTARLMLMIPGGLLSLFLPIVTEMYSKGDMEGLEVIYKTTTKWVFFINFPAFLILAFFSKQILGILFGAEYVAAGFALSLLVTTYFIISNFTTSVNLIIMMGKTKIVFYWSIFAGGSNMLLNYYLIPKYGIIGAAIATGVSVIIPAFLAFFFTYYFLKIQPIKVNYLKAVFSGGVTLIMVYFVTKVFFATVTIYVLIFISVLFFISYLFLLLILRSFEKEDIEVLKAIETKSGIKIGFLRDFVKKFI